MSPYRSPLARSKRERDRFRYAAWLRIGCRRLSGVYLIRNRQSGEVLYVGESHSGTLYKTITRHFQRWRRDDIWDERFPGFTVAAEDVVVGVRQVPARRALEAQDRLIRRYRPTHNIAPTTTGIDPAARSAPVPF